MGRRPGSTLSEAHKAHIAASVRRTIARQRMNVLSRITNLMTNKAARDEFMAETMAYAEDVLSDLQAAQAMQKQDREEARVKWIRELNLDSLTQLRQNADTLIGVLEVAKEDEGFSQGNTDYVGLSMVERDQRARAAANRFDGQPAGPEPHTPTRGGTVRGASPPAVGWHEPTTGAHRHDHPSHGYGDNEVHGHLHYHNNDNEHGHSHTHMPQSEWAEGA